MDDIANERQQSVYSSEFRRTKTIEKDERIAHALEFIAYRLGKIDDKLGELLAKKDLLNNA
jgi:hypothetical protein